LVIRPSNVDQLGDLGGDVRGGFDTPEEASVVDALASFGVVHADMPSTLANIWLAIQRPTCSEGPARQCFPEPPGPEDPRAATGRYGLAACAWSLAQVSLRPRVRLKTSRPGVESGSGQK
jgi:hypothetical protein